ncbi:MAG: hypothetical protein KKD44_07300 [Proteobacteria bacterium]|nr:hypothetical protein [Pseudomonadota bacterium]
MTLDDKKKCVEVWAMFTNEKTKPEDWNEDAANALAIMVAEIRKCSKAMDFVPRPSGSRPGYGWIVKYAYKVLKERYSSKQPRLYEACIKASYGLKSDVIIALNMGG